MEHKKRNPYIKTDREDYWKWKPDWYKDRHRVLWYESIDLQAITDASSEDVTDVIVKLIDYTRHRDQVIDHRQKVAFHVGFMLRFVIGSHEETIYTVEELLGILKMLREYLTQMQVVSALETDAPVPPREV